MIGGMARCRDYTNPNSFGPFGQRFGQLNFFQEFMFNDRWTMKNDGTSAAPGSCEDCGCYTSTPIRKPDGWYIRGGNLRNIFNEPPGSGFFSYGRTVLAVPPGYQGGARWFYFGPVAFILRKWRVAGICPLSHPPNPEAEPSEAAFVPDEPRDRVGYGLDAFDETKEAHMKYVLAYVKVNGQILHRHISSADGVHEQPIGPVKTSNTLSVEFMVNRSFFDTAPFEHGFSRKKFKRKELNPKTGEMEYFYDGVETASGRGLWDRAEIELHSIVAKPGAKDEPLWRPTYRQKNSVEQVVVDTSLAFDWTDALWGTRLLGDGFNSGFMTQNGSFTFGGGCPGSPPDPLMAAYPLVFGSDDFFVSLSGDTITPIVEEVDGQGNATKVRQNPAANANPCMHPVFVSQTGYFGPYSPPSPDGSSPRYYTWPNPLP